MSLYVTHICAHTAAHPYGSMWKAGNLKKLTDELSLMPCPDCLKRIDNGARSAVLITDPLSEEDRGRLIEFRRMKLRDAARHGREFAVEPETEE